MLVVHFNWNEKISLFVFLIKQARFSSLVHMRTRLFSVLTFIFGTMRFIIKIITFSTFLFFFSCEFNGGIEPTQSGLKGTIYFTNEKPAETDQIIVVASTVFPPSNITQIVQSEPLSISADSANFEIWIPPTDFAAVGVVWKQIDQPWDVTNIIGIYFPTENKFSPGSVEISTRNTVAEPINIQADYSVAKLKVDSFIEGTLQVNGSWPENATSVLVVASNNLVPTGLLDVTFGQPISAGFDSTTYSLNVQPGKYSLIGCLVLQENEPIGFESIKGIYYKKPTDFFPGSVTVETDTTVIKNVNISINF